MAKLGNPQTTKFSIGTAELRIGPLTQALKLLQGNSVGLIDSATVEVTQESVDLSGGFPKVLVDTAVVSQEASITATLREYSRRNIRILLGEGVEAEGSEPTDFSTTLASAAADTDTSLSCDDDCSADLAQGDLVVCYDPADLGNTQIFRVQSVVTTTITLDTDTPVFGVGLPSGAVVFLANHVAIGAISETNYFACQLLQVERATGRPVGFDFWKGSIGAGMTFSTNAEDFASTELNIKLLQPAASEYATAQDPLYKVRDLIPTHPTGIFYGGGDA